MLGIILGITIPVVYITLGSAIGFRVRRSTLGCDYHCSDAKDGRHQSLCDNGPTSVISGLIWPLIPFIWVGYQIGHKRPVWGNRRIRRAEKIAKRITDLEKDVFSDTWSGGK